MRRLSLFQGVNSMSKTARAAAAACVLTAAVCAVSCLRYARLGSLTALAVALAVHGLVALAVRLAWRLRFGALLVAAGIGCIVLGSCASYGQLTPWKFAYLLTAAADLAAGILLTVQAVRAGRPWPGRELLRREARGVGAFALCLLLALGSWGALFRQDRSFTPGAAGAVPTVWAVPACYEQPGAQQGTVEPFTYTTKAYATDSRTVTKQAYVYLPWNYDPDGQYNILYLLHGTGEDESNWLIQHPENKALLDTMIEAGDIDPLIVVTPTWYTENDCPDDPDRLTYAFAQELRKDLIPAVESHYAAWAASTEEQDLTASRDHRAFAGLSRGAATLFRSALEKNLDLFAWYGAFSGSFLDWEEWRSGAQSAALAGYPISYLYMTSGSFDFCLPGQCRDYKTLLAAEPRLIENVNTSFDVFPMRYHSMGSWHLALYNFLQKIFIA